MAPIRVQSGLREALLRLRGAKPWQELLRLLETKRAASLEGVSGAARGLAAAALAADTGRPVLVIVPDLESGRDLLSDLSAFLDPDGVCFFPDRDLAPYQPGPVSPQLAAQRLKTFSVLPERDYGVTVATVAALHEALPAPGRLKAQELELAFGSEIGREDLLHRLVAAGYRRVDLIELQGDFSARGGIIDVYCPALGRPLRVEMEGDTIASLRFFDADTQRSQEEIERARLGPAAEALLTYEERMSLLERLPDPLSRRGLQRVARLRDRLESGASLEGEERYLPWLLTESVHFADYLDPKTVVMALEPEDLESHSRNIYARVEALYEELTSAHEPLPRPAEFCLPPADTLKALERFDRVDLRQFAHVSEATSVRLKGRPVRYGPKEFKAFIGDLTKWNEAGAEVIVAFEQGEESEAIAARLREAQLKGARIKPPALAEGRLSGGVDLGEAGLVLLPARDVLGQPVVRAAPRRAPKAYRDVFAELKPGEPVVHEDYGIGLYRGIQAIPIDGIRQDFFLIEYADQEKLYLPVDQVHRVQKYLGADRPPKLSRLGTEAWERTKLRVKASLRRFAEELLALYAQRQVAYARPFAPHPEVEREFVRGFPYEETPDQNRSIAEVEKDLGAPKPMDRLVCGDVGYGKTEVALRAAFRVAMQGSQVAVLVPTTILAQQHYENFRHRLAQTPVSVELLSRFRNPEQRKRITAALAQGKIDVLVGTHQLLAKSVKFKDLGLLVIDEEHRFGVRQKEKLKELRKNVHVLTLSATPIPRTLNMGLSGLRDLSVIETPPPGRLSILTHVHEENPKIAREAVLRELARGGQVFYLHNRVQSLPGCAQRLRELVPEARLTMAHGQMPQGQLARAMADFANGKADVLVCTSIIGAGLDLPNANTLIVERADLFGLADLYQLRGRIGRSVRQAYAYFFFSPQGPPTLDARRRLAAMLEFGELGSGFRLAVRDLEIRGAGNLLGPQQHGAMLAVGFDLYTRILDSAVRELKGETVVEKTPPQISLRLEAFLPDEYIADGRSKLEIYKRLAACATKAEMDELLAEIHDRFGPPPGPARLLFDQAEVGLLGAGTDLESALRQGRQIVLKFHTAQAAEAARRRSKGRTMGRTLTVEVPAEPEGVLAAAKQALGGAPGNVSVPKEIG